MPSTRERQISYAIAYTWNLKKKDGNELIYKTDPQTQNTNLWLPKGKGGINQEFEINRYTLLYIKIDNQQGPTVKHRELYSIFCNKL